MDGGALKEVEMANKCNHIDQIRRVSANTKGCEECLKTGDTWVHLRMCLTCGHVGCCASSRNQHSLRHFRQTGHPLVRSIEPGEEWGWCYIDDTYLSLPESL